MSEMLYSVSFGFEGLNTVVLGGTM